MCHACLALYPRFIPNIYLKMSLNVASTDMELEHGINMELEQGNSPTANTSINPVWKVTMWSFLLVPVCFFCFHGHSQGKDFSLSSYAMLFIVMTVYLAWLLRTNAKHKEAVAALTGMQRGFMYFAVVTEVALLGCATAHYVRYK